MDWFDDFDDFEDEHDADSDMDDPLDGDPECDVEPNQTESPGDGFTTEDVFFLGSAIGFGYEEGSGERKRRKKRNRFVDDESE